MKAQDDRLKKLQARNRKLKKQLDLALWGLEFYACEFNWCIDPAGCQEFSCCNRDRGARAREYLNELNVEIVKTSRFKGYIKSPRKAKGGKI